VRAVDAGAQYSPGNPLEISGGVCAADRLDGIQVRYSLQVGLFTLCQGPVQKRVSRSPSGLQRLTGAVQSRHIGGFMESLKTSTICVGRWGKSKDRTCSCAADGR